MARSRGISVQYAIDKLSTVQLLKLYEAMQAGPVIGEEPVAQKVERIERMVRDALRQAFPAERKRKKVAPEKVVE